MFSFHLCFLCLVIRCMLGKNLLFCFRIWVYNVKFLFIMITPILGNMDNIKIFNEYRTAILKLDRERLNVAFLKTWKRFQVITSLLLIRSSILKGFENLKRKFVTTSPDVCIRSKFTNITLLSSKTFDLYIKLDKVTYKT